MPPDAPPVGLLPAAGRGARFGESGYAKELFPILLDGPTDSAPRPICDLALHAMRAAGALRCVTVVSREKLELLRVLGDGQEVGISLGYVVQRRPAGLPDVVRTARPWIGDAEVVFAMPDTIFLPRAALADVHARRRATGADLVLGVFPADEPERLGPVDLASDGAVRCVFDKPGETPFRNTWGIASWSPRFTEFCCAWEERRARENPDTEGILGHVFDAARVAGLAVQGLFFPEGRFLDVGTPRGLRTALLALTSEGLLAPGQATPAGTTPRVPEPTP